MERLEEYLSELGSTGLVSFVVLDGSFVTAKAEPEDVDLVFVLKREHDFGAELRPFEYNVLSRKSVRRMYQFDVLLAEEGEPEFDEYFAFFAQVRNEPDLTKGMLKVIP